MKRWAKALIGVSITVVALWYVLRDVDFREVLAQVATGNLLLLAASVFVATFGFFIRALRWKVLLAPVDPNTRLRSRFAGVSIGFMVNNVLPARLGEVARAYAFSRMEAVTAPAAFGSLVVERFMDGVVLLLFLVIPVFTPGFPEAEALSQGLGLAMFNLAIGLVLGILTVLVVMAALPKQFVWIAEQVTRLMPEVMAGKVMSALTGILDAIAIMRDPKLLVLGFAWTLAFWTWHGLSFWLGMLAFGIDTGFISAIFTEAVVGFAVAVPSAPGFVGTFHAGASFALSTVYGVSDPQALAFAFAYHFGGWIPITAIGLWYAGKLGLSLGDMGSGGGPDPDESDSADGSTAPAGAS
ncbi:MAG: lysylphosphatidylglycerol synthase transmembrane domain-containing protein [Gemmatimonadota bacterium]